MFETNATAGTDKGMPPSMLRDGFEESVHKPARCLKLGSLLLSAGLVTEEELDRALAAQKESGEPLGRILVRQGSLPAVQLYRKLAEQWCLKASVAGMAAMMAVPATASTAHGAAAAEFHSASVKDSASRDHKITVAYPSLFGTQEAHSPDTSAFKKWTAVMTRFEEESRLRGGGPRVMMWKAALREMRDLNFDAKVAAVNDYINQTRYVEDQANYGKSDYWATPAEFFSRGGDCEDFAIAKYASLRALGVEAWRLRIVIAQDDVKGQAHALLAVYGDEGILILDNQEREVRAAKAVSRYTPVFSINAEGWWLHKAPGGRRAV